VNDLIVHRNAGVGWVATGATLISMAGAPSTQSGDQSATCFFQVLRRNPGLHEWLEAFKHCGGDGTHFPHPRDRFPILDRNVHER